MISKIYTVTYIDLVAEGLGHMHKYLSRVGDVDDSMPQFKHPPQSKDMNSCTETGHDIIRLCHILA